MNKSDYNPKISTNTIILQRDKPLEKVLDLIKAAGFDAYDLTMASENIFFTSEEYIANAKRLRKYADRIGLICNQTHSIFPVYHHDFSNDVIKQRIDYTKRILEITSILGAKICVIHPINNFNEEQNFEYFQNYLPLANKLDVYIAIENMWNWKDGKASLAACSNHNNFKKLLDMINDDHCVACVDIGHAELDGLNTSAAQMIRTLGNYVKCLHIHDNDLKRDYHLLPYSGYISFGPILDALAEINYHGDITFECDGFLENMPEDLQLPSLELMQKVGQNLKKELLSRRKI